MTITMTIHTNPLSRLQITNYTREEGSLANQNRYILEKYDNKIVKISTYSSLPSAYKGSHHKYSLKDDKTWDARL